MAAALSRRHLDRELIRYVGVGVSGVFVDLSILAMLHEMAAVPLLAANAISFCVAVASNYRLNSYWTFRSRVQRPHLHGSLLFLFAAVIGLAVNEAGLWLLAQQLGMFYLWAKIGLVVVVFGWNYAFNSAVTFRVRSVPAVERTDITRPGRSAP